MKKKMFWVFGGFLLMSFVFVSCSQDENFDTAQVNNQLKVSAVTEVPPVMQAMMDSIDALEEPKLRASFGPQPGSPYPMPYQTGSSTKIFENTWYAMEISGSGSFKIQMIPLAGRGMTYFYSVLNSTGGIVLSSGTLFTRDNKSVIYTLSSGQKMWFSCKPDARGDYGFYYGAPGCC